MSLKCAHPYDSLLDCEAGVHVYGCISQFYDYLSFDPQHKILVPDNVSTAWPIRFL